MDDRIMDRKRLFKSPCDKVKQFGITQDLHAINFQTNLRRICSRALCKRRDWNEVFNFIVTQEQELQHVENLQTAGVILVDYLLRYGCGDLMIIKRIIEIYRRSLTASFQPLSFLDRLSPDRQKESRIDFRLSQKPNREDLRDFQIVLDEAFWVAFEIGDFRLAMCIVKNGYVFPPDSLLVNYLGLPEYIYEIWRYGQEKVLKVIVEPDVIENNKTRIKQLWESLKTQGNVCPKRIIFVLMILKAVLYEMNENESALYCSMQYVNSVKLLFRIIPDPFVSAEEIERLIQIVFTNQEHEDISVTMVRNYYRLFAPDATLKQRVRSLKHLCLCSLRKVFSKAPRPLPASVSALSIPQCLQQQLLCEEE